MKSPVLVANVTDSIELRMSKRKTREGEGTKPSNYIIYLIPFLSFAHPSFSQIQWESVTFTDLVPKSVDIIQWDW